MTKTILMLALLLAPLDNASAQTKDQCSEIATAFSRLVLSISPAEKAVSKIDWNLVTNATSGQVRNSAEAAKLAQINFLAATREYRIALEDVAQQGQLCAR